MYHYKRRTTNEVLGLLVSRYLEPAKSLLCSHVNKIYYFIIFINYLQIMIFHAKMFWQKINLLAHTNCCQQSRKPFHLRGFTHAHKRVECNESGIKTRINKLKCVTTQCTSHHQPYTCKEGCMTCSLTSFSTVFQFYRDDRRMKMQGPM